MQEWLFLIAGFGFLLAQGKATEGSPYSGRGTMKAFLIEGFHLFWQTGFLVLYYIFVIEMWLPHRFEKEPMILFFLLFAYALGQIQKKSHYFSLCVFCFAFLTTDLVDFSPLDRLLSVLVLALGVTFFQILVVGLKDKLLLVSLPKSLEGLPILLITASLIAMTLWSLQGILI